MKSILFGVFIFYIVINAQPASDSLEVSTAQDSLSISSIRQDSITSGRKAALPSKAFVLQPVYFDTLAFKTFRAQKIYDFNQLIFTNYNGFADAFRRIADYRVFDLLDMGEPRFIAGLNLLPHQTALAVNGSIQNDPISGLYNTRFLSLDAIAEIDVHNAENGEEKINVLPRTTIQDTPYSRIMYREGDFGYTALDIQFATKINKKLNVQLGGTNTFYDPNAYHGVIYRAQLQAQLAANWYSKTTLYLNREDTQIRKGLIFPYYAYWERRNRWRQDLYRGPADSAAVWHFWLGVNNSTRKNRFASAGLVYEFKYDRYRLGTERNWQIDSLTLCGRILATQTKIWGSPFSRRYTDSDLLARLKAAYPLKADIALKAALSTVYRYGRKAFWLPALSAVYSSRRFTAHLFIRQTKRYPLRTEQSFNAFPYSGNKNLKNEQQTNMGGSLSFLWNNHFKCALQAGRKILDKEILFNGTSFENGPQRHFSYFSAGLDYGFYKFTLAGGGQINLAQIHLAPAKSFWLHVRYHDRWLKGALITDAIGSFYAYDGQNQLEYNPVVERFYWTKAVTAPYYLFSYKLVATIKSAQIYTAMDNPFARQYSIINGYSEFYRRLQFGVNWVLRN